MAFSADSSVLLVLVITVELLSVVFFCKASILTEGTKPHRGCRDFVTKKLSPF